METWGAEGRFSPDTHMFVWFMGTHGFPQPTAMDTLSPWKDGALEAALCFEGNEGCVRLSTQHLFIEHLLYARTIKTVEDLGRR